MPINVEFAFNVRKPIPAGENSLESQSSWEVG